MFDKFILFARFMVSPMDYILNYLPSRWNDLSSNVLLVKFSYRYLFSNEFCMNSSWTFNRFYIGILFAYSSKIICLFRVPCPNEFQLKISKYLHASLFGQSNFFILSRTTIVLFSINSLTTSTPLQPWYLTWKILLYVHSYFWIFFTMSLDIRPIPSVNNSLPSFCF